MKVVRTSFIFLIIMCLATQLGWFGELILGCVMIPGVIGMWACVSIHIFLSEIRTVPAEIYNTLLNMVEERNRAYPDIRYMAADVIIDVCQVAVLLFNGFYLSGIFIFAVHAASYSSYYRGINFLQRKGYARFTEINS